MASLAAGFRTVLVVEAYAPSRFALAELLQDAGYRTITAADVEQAARIAAASELPIAAVVAEWDVGEASLLELAHALERYGNAVDIIRLPYANPDVTELLRRLARACVADGAGVMC